MQRDMNDPESAAYQHQEYFILRDLHNPCEKTWIAGERNACRIDVGLGMRTSHDRGSVTLRHKSHRRRNILDGRTPTRSQRRSGAEVLPGQGIDGQEPQGTGARIWSIELPNG